MNVRRIAKNTALGLLALMVVLALAAVAALAYLENQLRSPHEQPSAKAVAQSLPAANPQRNAYFGDLHVHTSMSLDANIFDTRSGPRMAYEFAKGREIALPGTGVRQKLMAPLDFAAVTDHAEGMGALHSCFDRAGAAYWTLDCIGIRHQVLLIFPRLFANLQQSGATLAQNNARMCGATGKACLDGGKSVWLEMQAAAREHYQPGTFTTFNGFEYSPTLVRGGMLHRNVIFRGEAVPFNVFSAMDGFVEDLMRWLDVQCKGDCKALTIPHNPNFSWGLMFGNTNSDGTPLTAANLALRAKYDALIEVFQAKGSSECTLGVGTTDEQCAFENIFPACTPEESRVDAQTGQHFNRCIATNDMVRNVLKRGLVDANKWGFNPYKLGIIGSTDNHNGAPGDTQESTWNGHAGVNDATPEQRLGIKRGLVAKVVGLSPATINPGGLVGVWAEQNTREAIWDALARKETFGTSGTRVRARLFAGFDFPADLHTRADAVAFAYQKGVPMGADLLTPALAGAAPSLLVMALRDANSAPLQRIQIVKGWVSGNETKEQVFDVACSDGIAPDPATHRCRDNGAKVDLSDCSISTDKGASSLSTTWRDPAFNPAVAAFYYVRVLENPVCRYSQRDALKLGAEHPSNVPKTIQERAWTSPVWYTPKNS
jgi:hypothetical protein